MQTPPFLTYPIRGKKDALLLRLKARRVAHLLRYDAHAQACIAAAAFVVAHQAARRGGRVDVCFVIDRKELHIYARPAAAAEPAVTAESATASHLHNNPLLRLAKPLPAAAPLDERDVRWLVRRMDEAGADDWYEEVVKQNEEVLAFLHELQSSGVYLNKMEGKTKNPSAA